MVLLLSTLMTGPGCGPPPEPPSAPRTPLTITVTKAGKPDVIAAGERVELTLTNIADGGRYTLTAGKDPGVYSSAEVPPGKYNVEMAVENPGGKPGAPKYLRFGPEVDVDPAKPAVTLEAPAGR